MPKNYLVRFDSPAEYEYFQHKAKMHGLNFNRFFIEAARQYSGDQREQLIQLQKTIAQAIHDLAN